VALVVGVAGYVALAEVAEGFLMEQPLHGVTVTQLYAYAQANEREACAQLLNLSRADATLAAGEMSAQEWRTVSAVLTMLQRRIRAGKP
jgi:hypothetical protein